MAGSFQKISKPTKYRAVDTSTSLQPTINVINDGGFGTDVAESTTGTYWITGDDCVIGSGSATWTNDSGDSSGNCTQTNLAHALEDGATYRVTFTLSGFNQHGGSGGFRVKLHGSAGFSAVGTTRTANNTYIEDLTIVSSGAPEANQVIIQTYGDPMSGTIDNISVQKLESFGNNNHGQIYSGRGLEFDGVSDYLQVSTVDNTEIGMTTASGNTSAQDNRTVAVWIKPAESGTFAANQHIWYASAGGGNEGYGLLLTTAGNITMEVNDGGGTRYQTTSVLADHDFRQNTWMRVVAVFDAVNCNHTLYVNGIQLMNTDTAQWTGDVTPNNHIVIGGHYDAGTYPYDGMMSDFQVWNELFTQSDATFDYLNPESLALNNGGTSLTESNLKLWYPMQDGHRGQQSYILDGANTGLGPNLLSNGDMESDSDWANKALEGGFPVSDSSEVAQYSTAKSYTGSRSIYISTDDANEGVQNTSVTPIAGKTYRMSCWVFLVSGEYVEILAEEACFTDTLYSNGGAKGEWKEIVVFGTCNNASQNIVFQVRAGTAATEWYMDNASIRVVNDKHHATTEFLGDEQISATNDRTFAGASNWANNSGDNAFASYDETTSGQLTVTPDDVSDTQSCSLDGANWEDAETGIEAMVEGRTYRLSYDIHVSAFTKGTLSVGLSQDDTTRTMAFSNDYTATNGSGATATLDFVYTASTCEMISIKAAANTVLTADFDNFSLKEVGTASGWTDADQQLDIPQTALQSYNQLAWFGDDTEELTTQYVTLATDITTFRGETVSFWFITDTDDEQVLVSGLLNCGSYGNVTINDAGNIGKITVATAKGDDSSEVMTATTWNDGQWHHCVVVVEGDGTDTSTAVDASNMNSFFSIYVDGEKQTLEADGGYRGTTDALIGCRKLSSVYKYSCDGSITEVSAWSNEFTGAEVEELYNDGKALNAEDHSQYTNCIGYWRNNGLAPWVNIKNPGTNNGVVSAGLTETLLLPAGVDSYRDTQGFIMNKQKNTNALNLTYSGYDADGYVDLVAETTRAAGNPFSITLWIKPSHVDDNRFIGSGADYIRFRNTTQIRISADSTTDNIALSSGTWDIDEWVHMGIVRNASNVVTMYIDGEAQNNATRAEPFDYRYIGAFDSTDTFHGAIDDVCIYHDELSATEVKRNYNAGKRSHR